VYNHFNHFPANCNFPTHGDAGLKHPLAFGCFRVLEERESFFCLGNRGGGIKILNEAINLKS
jgi:hypothetical protein